MASNLFFLSRCVKGVTFFNGSNTKGVPFLSEKVYTVETAPSPLSNKPAPSNKPPPRPRLSWDCKGNERYEQGN